MTAFLIILFVLLAINVCATRRVVATPNEFGIPKRMLIAGIWIMPFFGALIAKTHTPGPVLGKQSEAMQPLLTQPEAPIVIEGADTTSFSVMDHLAFVNGIPILDWGALS